MEYEEHTITCPVCSSKIDIESSVEVDISINAARNIRQWDLTLDEKDTLQPYERKFPDIGLFGEFYSAQLFNDITWITTGKVAFKNVSLGCDVCVDETVKLDSILKRKSPPSEEITILGVTRELACMSDNNAVQYYVPRGLVDFCLTQWPDAYFKYSAKKEGYNTFAYTKGGELVAMFTSVKHVNIKE